MTRFLTILLLVLLSVPATSWAIPVLNAYVAGTFQNSASVTTLADTIPAAWHAGDCMIVVCATTSTSVTWTAPTGFTSIYTNGGVSPPNYWVGRKQAVAADVTGSATVTCSTSAGAAGNLSNVIFSVTNNLSVAACVGSNSALGNAVGTSISVTAATVSTLGDLNIGVAFIKSTTVTYSAQSNSVLGAMTDFHQDGYVDVFSASGYTATGAGASGTVTATMSASAAWNAFQLTIKPAPAGSFSAFVP